MSTIIAGLVGGAVATLAMDLVWFVRSRRSGGRSGFFEWELAVGLDSWDKAPAPAKLGKLFFETAFRRELASEHAALTTNLMHWGYGVAWGALASVAVGSPRQFRLRQGPLLGALVWLASYVSLPVAGFYQPIWRYDLKTLWQDLSAHLVYGTCAVLVMKAGAAARARRRADELRLPI